MHDKKIHFPSTRYSGSKRRFLDWIWDSVKDIKFKSALDVFGGTGSVGLLLKSKGKRVLYNDLLFFNQIIGKAIIENQSIIVSDDEVEKILNSSHGTKNSFIQNNFKNIFFLDDENIWLDKIIENINKIENEYKKAIIMSSLFQACLSKRPFNLFHRANLNIRTNDVKRTFGNKTTWEKPFPDLLKKFINEYNRSIFSNEQDNKVIGGYHALLCPNGVDLVYLDPPYFSNGSSQGTDYLKYYHFLEGISNYRLWDNLIEDHKRRLPKLKDRKEIDSFIKRSEIYKSIEKLIERFQDNIIIMSYQDEGIPSKNEILSLFKKYGKKVKLIEKPHKYVLSKKNKSELLFITN